MPEVAMERMSRRTFVAIGTNQSGTYHLRDNERTHNQNGLAIAQEQKNRTRSLIGFKSLSRGTINQLTNRTSASSSKSIKSIKCIVHFLDNSQHSFEIDKRSKGQILLDNVFTHLELIERDYFGLQYIETKSHGGHAFLGHHLFPFNQSNWTNKSHSSASDPDVYKWLDPNKSIKKQLQSDATSYTFYFRVKFYVSEPSKLQEEFTRYHFFLQLRRDLIEKRLPLPHSSAVLLASYAVQSELGDFSADEHTPGYLSDLQLLPNQTPDIEKEIGELHKLHRGQTPADAELNFLEHAKTLDFYGIELHASKDESGNDLQVGIGSQGIVLFRFGNRVNSFSWTRIVKICFKRKQFFVQIRKDEYEQSSSDKDSLVCFHLASYSQCKAIWKSCVEHHTFFRLQTPRPQTKKFLFFFTFGSRYRYSGKTEFQTLEESRQRIKSNRTFVRSSSKRYVRQTMPTMHVMRSPNGRGPTNGYSAAHPSNLRSSTYVQPSYAHNRTECAIATSTTDANANDLRPRNVRSTASFWFSSTTSKLIRGISSSMTKLNSSRLSVARRSETRSKKDSTDASTLKTPGPTSVSINPSANDTIKPRIALKSSSNNQHYATFSSRSARAYSRSVSSGNVQPLSRRLPQRQSLGNLNSGYSLHPNGIASVSNNPSGLTTITSSCLTTQTAAYDGGWPIGRSTVSRTMDSVEEQSQQQHFQSLTNGYVGSIRRSSLSRMSKNNCNGLINNNNRCQVTERCSLVPKPAWIEKDDITTLDSSKAALSVPPLASSVSISTTSTSNVSMTIAANSTNHNKLSATNSSSTSTSALTTVNPNNNSTAFRSHSAFPLNRTSGPCPESSQLSNQILDTLVAASSNHSTNLKQLRLRLLGDASNTSPNHNLLAQSLYTLRIRPDDQGRFGFNVKGGSDQNSPVLVSRVLPHTPADVCVPKLNEGDQVIGVNGISVDGLTHDQVVQLIRCSKDRSSGNELMLVIRPNMFLSKACADTDKKLEEDEPTFQYIPVDASPVTRNKSQCDLLHQSIMLIYEGLESEALIDQFEKLYSKKHDEKFTAAKNPINLTKNRYCDISPYDSTRVVLNESPSGDYINASYVNMEVPTSGIVNRYIATQGPLESTCDDFWQMVWEQKSALIVMVTPLVEESSIKCYKYWPSLNESLTCHGTLHLKCTKQIETPAMIEREFRLTRNGEERICTHLQYLAWPDHGVPNEPTQFLELIFKVRQHRCGLIEPIIVHCSAGIGRTGVLILMETAMCLIEANEPIFPLEILKTMRDQRASLIQTSAQFQFVLEAICRVYKDQLVKPQYETS